MPTTRWDVELPIAAELPALPRGIVLHWTGGGRTANSADLGAYHFVVEHDATVRRGRWPVGANMRQVGGDDYAIHTGGFNSFRVGISAAGMKDYVSREQPGHCPLTEVQVRRMAEVAAYFLALAALDPLDPRRLCTHREVWTLHSIKGKQNHLKRDIEFLPFRPDLGRDEVGDFLRGLAAAATPPTVHPIDSDLRPAIPVIVPDVVEVRVPTPSPSPVLAAGETSWWGRLLERIRR
ncbi:MAG TPA: N-acetylmuramoyl-L-alanine amidase [Longimicrobiaceae bacterium]|nr:N-acetylmuramoyl-L-alanine amidase [Longimicrobiaceae bacterium]